MTDGITPLAPGSTIGILGGGQLGRMLSMAAARLGLRTHIFDPGDDPPAANVSHRLTSAQWLDEEAVRAFAQDVDVVTYEFENVPAAALDLMEDLAPIRPGRRALEVSQDRAVEKTFLSDLGIRVAPWSAFDTEQDLADALAATGVPAILKVRTMGYDGKGQVRVGDPSHGAHAWAAVFNAPSIFEGLVPFEREISIIVARSVAGKVVCFDPAENVHRDGILHTSTASSAAARGVRVDAALIAGKIVNALDYVGVMGVEFFALPGNALLVNEIAPRVHNSGHWTIEACVVDQFEQHIRAISGWPLGNAERHSDAVMTNLIGAEVDAWLDLAGDGGLHLYGKKESRPGRKMGHVTRISPRPSQ